MTDPFHISLSIRKITKNKKNKKNKIKKIKQKKQNKIKYFLYKKVFFHIKIK
jgi:hypothetical protein